MQGYDFGADMRVLDVPGYDVILGMDWICEVGPVTIDGKKGDIRLGCTETPVYLKIEGAVAEVRLCDSEIDLQKEKKKGS